MANSWKLWQKKVGLGQSQFDHQITIFFICFHQTCLSQKVLHAHIKLLLKGSHKTTYNKQRTRQTFE